MYRFAMTIPGHISLIGVGWMKGTPAGEVKAGMIRHYNYGSTAEITEVKQENGWIYITVKSESGIILTDKKRPTTLVPVSEKGEKVMVKLLR